ncbi:nucleotidyl transferase AbiEii/AbiGii toxin family protein [Rhizobium sp. Leaf391]|uniref:nucleotidyl transferase AbiEii/AbiGii toxin family protein n=1 Tax=Rhizobium sp. Leaf391 TaxID=1736360 RepID=UPI0009E7AEA0|nr:nucleotidyl transferase AbiEii/AbiGii toxin family protein [Rhizobium sp. Leaf391]
MSTLTPDLGDRLKHVICRTCKHNNLDDTLALQRFTVEQILTGFQRTIKVPFAVGGGLIHHQMKRETGNADIRFVRQLEEKEILQSLRDMGGFLASRGIRLKRVSAAQERQMHAGTKGMHFKFEAFLGSTRVKSHLDIGFRAGRYSFPEAKLMKRELPEFFIMQRELGLGFRGWAFPKETQIAEKLCTSLQRGAENTRLNDFWDVAFMSGQGQGIDRELLIHEMTRVIYERQLEYILDDVMVSIPEAMSLDFIDANAHSWQIFLTKRRRVQWTDFDKVMDRVRELYGSIRQDVVTKVERHMVETSVLFEEPKIAKGVEVVSRIKGSIAERKAARNLPAGVIDLEEEREARMGPR